ncbi:transcriptional repressor [Erysipelothrix sp. HDW6B]|uniref:Fur family transcriptional regulator n=1 Tax=Erysipelothrix TaxID=1647 RepID=UPI00135AE989|nr:MULTISPECIES: transcriptional repressor [Erysipelothrix]QIK85208.1 transcriptional repressor [Erysipelothrix sp. HDW6B]
MSLKLTKQRQEILDVIQASDGHMTADEIHSTLKEHGVSVGIATIYRNLNVLYAEKLINRVRHPELGFIYDKNLHDHYHFRCRECNRIQDVEIEYRDDLHALVEQELGCLVIDHDMSFEGICSECLKKRTKKS